MPVPSLVLTSVRLRVLALVVAVVACSPERGPDSLRPIPAVLLVENRSTDDVVVYLADGLVPRRLGRVPALARSRLVVPNHAAVSGTRILVHSEDSREAFVAERAAAGVGGVLELTVQPLLEQSTLSLLSFAR